MSILVFCDKVSEKLSTASKELLSCGKKIAEEKNVPLIALSVGTEKEESLQQLANFGADKIYNRSDISFIDCKVVSDYIFQVCQQENVSILLFANDYSGKMLAPRLAIKLDAPLVSNISQMNGNIFSRDCYSGKAVEHLKMEVESYVCTLASNAFDVVEKQGKGEMASLANFSPASSVKFVKQEIRDSSHVSLPEAEIVVSGGRGLKGAENWGMIDELADSLDASTACSRPVSDSGWRPHHEHVGQTGTQIRPKVYFAIGISGAIQHLAGVSGSKTKVVINSDPEAPFFKAADYGMVGDAFEIVPQLIEEIKKRKA